MREIKFRQAIFKNGEFHHWNYWGFVGYRNEFVGPIAILGIHNEYEVKESQQYIGLPDKNGGEIYEGDIVSVWDEAYSIRWGNGGFFAEGYCMGSQDNPEDFFSEDAVDNCEVIGNIYENPELLGEGVSDE